MSRNFSVVSKYGSTGGLQGRHFHHIIWRSCGFINAGLIASGGPPADPWEVLDIDAQHWQLYVPRADSAVRGHDKTGQLCHIPLAFYVEADCLPSLSITPSQHRPL